MRDTPDVSARDITLLDRAVQSLGATSKFAVTFGGLAIGHGVPLSSFAGTIGQSIHGLVIEPREGLGGQALATRHPAYATKYQRTRSITRRYEPQVTAEKIVSLVAIPVIVDDDVRAVLYGGFRVQMSLGDVALDAAFKVASTLSWEMSVLDEVDRRLAVAEPGGAEGEGRSHFRPTSDSVRRGYAELREIAQLTADPLLRARLDKVGSLLIGDSGPARHPVSIAPRERDVIALVALGLRNAQIAHRLGLEESTVKAYVSSSMRKLGASSRFEAVLKARAAALLP